MREKATDGKTIPPSNGKTEMHTRLLPTSGGSPKIPKIGLALMRLCASKDRTRFTEFDLDTWTTALSVYDDGIVVREIITLALSADPFPSLGKLVEKCERERRLKAGTMPTTDGPIRNGMLDGIATAWGLT